MPALVGGSWEMGSCDKIEIRISEPDEQGRQGVVTWQHARRRLGLSEGAAEARLPLGDDV